MLLQYFIHNYQSTVTINILLHQGSRSIRNHQCLGNAVLLIYFAQLPSLQLSDARPTFALFIALGIPLSWSFLTMVPEILCQCSSITKKLHCRSFWIRIQQCSPITHYFVLQKNNIFIISAVRLPVVRPLGGSCYADPLSETFSSCSQVASSNGQILTWYQEFILWECILQFNAILVSFAKSALPYVPQDCPMSVYALGYRLFDSFTKLFYPTLKEVHMECIMYPPRYR